MEGTETVENKETKKLRPCLAHIHTSDVKEGMIYSGNPN